MKPVINLDELELRPHGSGPFQGSYAPISAKIGAQKLGYNLTICPPGKTVCPVHNHHVLEEVFLILEGEGLLSYGDKTYPLRAHDVIACPAGKRDVAHQILNTGTTDLKYFALSTKEHADICEYPDSDKVGVYVGEFGRRDMQFLFKPEQAVNYFDGESLEKIKQRVPNWEPGT